MNERLGTGPEPRSDAGRSLRADVPEDLPVGDGPLYEVMKAEARKLVPLFQPGGPDGSQNWWGCGFFGVSTEDDGSNVVHTSTFGWERRGLGHMKALSIEELRATAISLLVYCEAHEVSE